MVKKTAKVGQKMNFISYLQQDQVNNADSAIIFLINHWSVRIVKVVWSVRVVEVVQDVQIVHDWHAWSRSQGLKVSRSQGLKVSGSQGLKVSGSQGLKVLRSQGLKV